MEPRYNIIISLRSGVDHKLDTNRSGSIWFNKAIIYEFEDDYVFQLEAADGAEFLVDFPLDTEFRAVLRFPMADVLGLLYRDTPMDPALWAQYLTMLDPSAEPQV